MHLVPTEGVSSLFNLTLEAVNALVRGSNLKGEDDIKSAKGYLDELPSTIKLRIAKSWGQELNFCCIWLDKARKNYALWRVTCFWPNEKGASLDFRIRLKDPHHFCARALKYVTEQCSVQEIKNSAVTIDGYLSFKCKSHFKTLLSHCAHNLTEVTLKGNIGDGCLKAVGEQCKNLRRLTLDRLTKTSVLQMTTLCPLL